MPIIVACPSCNGKLRVADDLLGGKVRCPACNATFDAHANGAAPGQESPPDLSPVAPDDGQWKDLPLELAEPPAEKKEEAPTRDLSAAWDDYGLDLPAPPTEPPAPAPEPKREPETPAIPIPPVAPWPELSLDEPSPAGPGGLVGAVELTPDGGTGPPPPRRREPPPPAPREEDLKECPHCRKFVSRDAPRCYHCGQRFRGPDGPEREARRAPRDEEPLRGPRPRRERLDRPRMRRDTIPHRGGLILGLGIASIALLVMTTGCASPITLILGLIAWIMGQGDLRKIRRNEVDPEGEGLTQGGWICGIIGTILSCLLLLGCVGFWGMMYMEETRRVRTTRPKFGAPQRPFRPGPPRPRPRPPF